MLSYDMASFSSNLFSGPWISHGCFRLFSISPSQRRLAESPLYDVASQRRLAESPFFNVVNPPFTASLR